MSTRIVPKNIHHAGSMSCTSMLGAAATVHVGDAATVRCFGAAVGDVVVSGERHHMALQP